MWLVGGGAGGGRGCVVGWWRKRVCGWLVVEQGVWLVGGGTGCVIGWLVVEQGVWLVGGGAGGGRSFGKIS